VTGEDFRRELGDAFGAISGSPSPALSDRVRLAPSAAPERRGPVWIASVAAAVIAVILVGVLVVANPLNRGSLLPVGSTHSTPSASPAPSPSPQPTPSPSPVASPNASGFNCSASNALTAFDGLKPPPSAFIDAVRLGTHPGYDRLTIEFENGQPTMITLGPQNSATFTRSPRGDTVKLAGQDGIVVYIQGSDAHTAYKGSTDIKTGFSGLLEVREIQDFEGSVQWALGLAKPACYRAQILTNPVRLVIDIQTS
jgi:hypothetical protein